MSDPAPYTEWRKLVEHIKYVGSVYEAMAQHLVDDGEYWAIFRIDGRLMATDDEAAARRLHQAAKDGAERRAEPVFSAVSL